MKRIHYTDSYKWSHFRLYNPEVTSITSYIEARGVEKGRNWQRVMMAGMTPFLHDLINADFGDEKELDKLERLLKAHGVSYNPQWRELLKRHNGRLPLTIQALPEGMVVPLGTPMVQITTDDPDFVWLGQWLETQLLRAIWYPSSVATQSLHIKAIIAKYLDETADSRASLPFQLHDFGARGATSHESAKIGGLAHLYNFQGTDTWEAVIYATEIFHDAASHIPAYSVDAAEHSTITSFGGPEHELDAFRACLEIAKEGNRIVSAVSDTYNIWNAISNIWGGVLKDEVIALGEIGSKIVIRPDSGDPRDMVINGLMVLGSIFGYSTNGKGFKVLPSYIGLIQGDGVDEAMIAEILELMKINGWSAENIVFGMGGALLQKVNRDTLKFAQKACSATLKDGTSMDMFKDPITDSGKRSKKGRQAVTIDDSFGIKVIREDELEEGDPNYLLTVYGKFGDTYGLQPNVAHSLANVRTLSDWGVQDIIDDWAIDEMIANSREAIAAGNVVSKEDMLTHIQSLKSDASDNASN